MPDAISAVASVQLGVLQAPEVAREQVPIAAQAQIANAQAGAIIARQDQEASETVQRLREIDRQAVQDTLHGGPGSEYPSYRRRGGAGRQPVEDKAVALAAAHPRGLGALVDVRA